MWCPFQPGFDGSQREPCPQKSCLPGSTYIPGSDPIWGAPCCLGILLCSLCRGAGTAPGLERVPVFLLFLARGLAVLRREMKPDTCVSNRYIPNGPGLKSLKKLTYHQIPGAQLISLNSPLLQSELLPVFTGKFLKGFWPLRCHGVHRSSTVPFLLYLIGWQREAFLCWFFPELVDTKHLAAKACLLPLSSGKQSFLSHF